MKRTAERLLLAAAVLLLAGGLWLYPVQRGGATLAGSSDRGKAAGAATGAATASDDTAAGGAGEDAASAAHKAPTGSASVPAGTGGQSPNSSPVEPGTADLGVTELTCRVVQRAGDTLLLARQEGAADEVYTLSLADLSDESGSFGSITAGDLVVVTFSGRALEVFPLELAGVERVSPVRGGTDDLCALYLQVLEDLWKVDSGLNGGLTQIAVDLSSTSLWPSEQAAVGWQFAKNHRVSLVSGGYDTLKAECYLTPDDPKDPDGLYHWADGCLFSITEDKTLLADNDTGYSLRVVHFGAMKWRSGTGAYWFRDCTAVQSALGRWDGYAVGSQAIA